MLDGMRYARWYAASSYMACSVLDGMWYTRESMWVQTTWISALSTGYLDASLANPYTSLILGMHTKSLLGMQFVYHIHQLNVLNWYHIYTNQICS